MSVDVAVAWAHEGWVFHQYDKAGTYEAHKHIDWCDEEADGNRVYTRWYYGIDLNNEVFSQVDPDGAGGQCGHYPNLAWPVARHRVCEYNADPHCSIYENH